MSKRLFETILPAPLVAKYQRRLSSYLYDYEYRHKVTAKEVAEKIGISSQKFSYVKSETKPYGRFINSIDLFTRLANLENMSVVEFFEYIEGQREKDNAPSQTSKVYNWQKILINAFEPIKTAIRIPFIDFCKKSAHEGKEKLELLLEIVNILQTKDYEAIKSFRDLLKK